MTTKTYSLQLDGAVSLKRFTEALVAWRATLSAIASDEHVPMTISNLQYGSAIVETDLEFSNEAQGVDYDKEFAHFATGVRSGNVIDFPAPQKKAADRLIKAASLDAGQGLVISSPEVDIVVNPSPTDSLGFGKSFPVQLESWGALLGRLQSINSRNRLKVVLYDQLFDRAVKVALTDNQRELARELWDKDVVVEGMIRRDPKSGRPLSIRDVTHIAKREQADDKYGWMKARGALSHVRPDLSLQELIGMARGG